MTLWCLFTDSARLFCDDRYESPKNRLLCISVVDCLHKCFLYDTEGFVNRQRFNLLMQPLVDQVSEVMSSCLLLHTMCNQGVYYSLVQLTTFIKDFQLKFFSYNSQRCDASTKIKNINLFSGEFGNPMKKI